MQRNYSGACVSQSAFPSATAGSHCLSAVRQLDKHDDPVPSWVAIVIRLFVGIRRCVGGT